MPSTLALGASRAGAARASLGRSGVGRQPGHPSWPLSRPGARRVVPATPGSVRRGSAATIDFNISAAAADAKALLDVAGGVLGGGEARRVRFEVASKNLDDEVHGAYGEFPLTGLLAVLEHPAVNEVLVAAEHGWGSSEGSVDDADRISRAAAFHKEGDCPGEECPFEETPNAFQPSLVDIGSGAGRLILAASTMRAWRSVVGIEASKPLAGLGAAAIQKLEKENVLPEGLVRSVHADANLGSGSVECLFDASCPADPAGVGDGGAIAAAASALAGADVALAYSTAFPSPDGLRLPELSAALEAVMRPGAVVVTTDKWLVGSRFEFADMLIVQGEEGPEDKIRCFIWRVKGEIPVGALGQDSDGRAGVALVAERLARINDEWMDEEDACSQNPEACAMLLESLENELSVAADVADMDEGETTIEAMR